MSKKMRLRGILSFTLAACLYFPPSVSTGQSARKLKAMEEKEAQVTTENLRKHIAVLSADSLEGRRAGSEGEIKAANYIAAFYRKMGIAPADADKNYIQEFEIDEGKVISADSWLRISDQPLEVGKDWFPLAWGSEGKIRAAAALALHERGYPWWVDLKETMESKANNPHFLAEQYVRDLARDAAMKGASAVFVYILPASTTASGSEKMTGRKHC